MLQPDWTQANEFCQIPDPDRLTPTLLYDFQDGFNPFVHPFWISRREIQKQRFSELPKCMVIDIDQLSLTRRFRGPAGFRYNSPQHGESLNPPGVASDFSSSFPFFFCAISLFLMLFVVDSEEVLLVSCPT